MYKMASFFAGVGGIDLAFEQTGKFKTVYANEFDPAPAKTFALNFPDAKLDVQDIRTVDINNIPEFDIMTGGFPCQAFSVAGLRQGFDDEKNRGTLFFDMAEIFRVRKPRVMLFENVKNLVGHDNGNTFRVICETIKDAGYHISYQVLNAMNYGNIPQNRERIYIVCFREKEDYNNFEFPESIPLKKTIKGIINFRSKVDDKYYYTDGKYKGDMYRQLVDAMDDENAIYQWRRKYVRKNQSGVVPTLTANQGEGGHNVCLVKTKFGIRKMTPRECFNTQGFPASFKLPSDLADSKLYKQAGNSVCVTVINRIAENIAAAMESTSK